MCQIIFPGSLLSSQQKSTETNQRLTFAWASSFTLPVVFISMTASSAEEVPRGISFLLNRNRLNVAISRAQYAAVIVRSQLLTEYLPGTPAGLIDLGAFLALTQPTKDYLPDECRP